MYLIRLTFDEKKLFTFYYNKNIWGASSKSGPGSTDQNTVEITKLLPKLLKDFHIKSILDIPCGDFLWLSKINLEKIEYTGVDIVDDIIRLNQEKFSNNRIVFKQGNIFTFDLNGFDLILCRDLFIHFSNRDIMRCLANIRSSNSKYLLTTFFQNRTSNKNIKTGQFSPLNLTVDPFRLPQPLYILNEKCIEENGFYSDKSLGLWRINEI